MKRAFAVFLLIGLLLAGCGTQETPENADTTGESLPQGYYVPDSPIEKETGGAVKLYQLPGDNYNNLSGMGDQLLVSTSAEKPELTVLTGAECIPTARMTLPVACGQALYNGYAYYDAAKKQAVFLDAQLQESGRLQLPDHAQGIPVFAPDGEEVFYCAGQEIYGIEVERKLSRLIKTHSYTALSLIDCYFEGKLISCRTPENETIYISTETGQTMYSGSEISAFYTYEDSFLVLRTDGTVRQRIVGQLEKTAQQLNVADTEIVGAIELGGVFGWSLDENNTLQMNFYDIASGKMTASQAVSQGQKPLCVYADRWCGSVWILCQDGSTLLRWQIKDAKLDQETVYLGPVFTAEAPDEEGLAECTKRVKALNKKHGVSIRIWKNAVKQPGSYTLQVEHQTDAIQRQLDALTSVLAEYPSKFLKKSISSKIRICLVRAIDGKQQAVQFWNKDDAYIVLTEGVDVRNEFARCLGYIVDSHVLGNSPDYDYWPGLNPEGFVYGAENQKKEYLTGETRYFTSENAMTSQVEDRSEIFYHAMRKDNQEMFQTAAMQKKLTKLCKAIRDAWDTKKETDVFPWEQYLEKSVAYKKK